MNHKEFLTWAKEIAEKQHFLIQDELYHGIYYQQDHVRNVILLGTYQSKPAVLKVYDDPRFVDEPSSLQAFLDVNTSTKLIAPELYAAKELDEHRGWLIMEYLEQGSFLTTPLAAEQRTLFLDLYAEYKNHFPKTPHRPLMEMEQLTSFGYTKQKLNQWKDDFLQAEAKRKEQGKQLFYTEEFALLYDDCINFFETSYKDLPLEWLHGHFKPQEIFVADNGQYYLTDFAHTKMVPKGYELAFIIWADTIMSLPPSTPYREWKAGIDEWVELIAPHLAKIPLEEIHLQAAIVERILGTLLRDFGSSDKPDKDIAQVFALGITYLKEVVH